MLIGVTYYAPRLSVYDDYQIYQCVLCAGLLRAAIEVVSVKPLEFNPNLKVDQATAVTLANGKKCFLNHNGVVAGVTEQEFVANLTQ